MKDKTDKINERRIEAMEDNRDFKKPYSSCLHTNVDKCGASAGKRRTTSLALF